PTRPQSQSRRPKRQSKRRSNSSTCLSPWCFPSRFLPFLRITVRRPRLPLIQRKHRNGDFPNNPASWKSIASQFHDFLRRSFIVVLLLAIITNACWYIFNQNKLVSVPHR